MQLDDGYVISSEEPCRPITARYGVAKHNEDIRWPALQQMEQSVCNGGKQEIIIKFLGNCYKYAAYTCKYRL